jgi:hypothetical protein
LKPGAVRNPLSGLVPGNREEDIQMTQRFKFCKDRIEFLDWVHETQKGYPEDMRHIPDDLGKDDIFPGVYEYHLALPRSITFISHEMVIEWNRLYEEVSK